MQCQTHLLPQLSFCRHQSTPRPCFFSLLIWLLLWGPNFFAGDLWKSRCNSRPAMASCHHSWNETSVEKYRIGWRSTAISPIAIQVWRLSACHSKSPNHTTAYQEIEESSVATIRRFPPPGHCWSVLLCQSYQKLGDPGSFHKKKCRNLGRFEHFQSYPMGWNEVPPTWSAVAPDFWATPLCPHDRKEHHWWFLQAAMLRASKRVCVFKGCAQSVHARSYKEKRTISAKCWRMKNGSDLPCTCVEVIGGCKVSASVPVVPHKAVAEVSE